MYSFIVFSFLLALSSCQDDNPGIYQIIEPIDHSEAPTWDSRTNSLYFVNIHAGQIFRYAFATHQITSITLDGEIAPVIPSKSSTDVFYAGLNRSVVRVAWDGISAEPSSTQVLTTVSQQFPTSRFNDGKADKNGRLWIGTMGHEDASGLTPDEGVFYRVTCEELDSPQVEIAPVNISNGIAFNKANNKLFYIDTPTQKVMAYDYDSVSGRISSPTVAFDVSKHADKVGGSPDGMTIDSDDNLWVALYGGWTVVKVDPSSGEVLQIIVIPAEDVTSAMWGGPNLDVLYVTTSRYTLTEEERKQQPQAGSVFAIIGLKARGVEMFGADLEC